MDTGVRFWLRLGGLVVLGALVAMIVFLIVGAAFLTWGLLGGLALVGAIMLGFGWLVDRRNARTAHEWEEANL